MPAKTYQKDTMIYSDSEQSDVEEVIDTQIEDKVENTNQNAMLYSDDDEEYDNDSDVEEENREMEEEPVMEDDSDDEAPEDISTSRIKDHIKKEAMERKERLLKEKQLMKEKRRVLNEKYTQQQEEKKSKLLSLIPESLSDDVFEDASTDAVDDNDKTEIKKGKHLRPLDFMKSKKSTIKDIPLDSNNETSIRVVSLDNDGSQELINAVSHDDEQLNAAKAFRNSKVKLDEIKNHSQIKSKLKSMRDRKRAEKVDKNKVLWTLHPELFDKNRKTRVSANTKSVLLKELTSKRQNATSCFSVRKNVMAPATFFKTRK